MKHPPLPVASSAPVMGRRHSQGPRSRENVPDRLPIEGAIATALTAAHSVGAGVGGEESHLDA
eukprot:2737508-Pyramimonas_sp.AAC.1